MAAASQVGNKAFFVFGPEAVTCDESGEGHPSNMISKYDPHCGDEDIAPRKLHVPAMKYQILLRVTSCETGVHVLITIFSLVSGDGGIRCEADEASHGYLDKGTRVRQLGVARRAPEGENHGFVFCFFVARMWSRLPSCPSGRVKGGSCPSAESGV